MHLLVDISAHGLGHLAQTAPVLAELGRQIPSLRLTVRSGLQRDQLSARIHLPFAHIHDASDFGFVMHNAVDIDFAASLLRYREFHLHWERRIADAAAELRGLKVDAVLSNAAYLPLAAARQAGIAAAGMCSLNWADLFAHYFPTETAIQAQMLAAYNAADVFLRVTPGMPMEGFQHRHNIGPIAHLAKRPHARKALDAALNIPAGTRCVLAAMGGMEFRLPIESWPTHDNLIYLCPASWGLQRADVRDFDTAGWPFTDLLANVDAVLTKPGYGTFVEAACNGTPVLYVPRDNWPEEFPMAAWLQQHGRCAAIDRQRLMAGHISSALDALWQQTEKPRPLPTGINDAAEILVRLYITPP
jgi:hypothetical protein